MMTFDSGRFTFPSMKPLTEEEFLSELRARGVATIRRVNFKENRSTIWSITGGGGVLNLHLGFALATPELIDSFARIVADPRGSSLPTRTAMSAVKRHPPLRDALARVRSKRPSLWRGLRLRRRTPKEGPNCATPAQQAYLEALYAFLNDSRFDGRLPTDIPIRLSRRMKSTYGWVTLHSVAGFRKIGELALHLDLMLEENDERRIDVMVHEMAHIATWLTQGERGHGAAWKAMARRVGCEPRACTRQTIQPRGDRGRAIHRVPPLPPGTRGDGGP